MSAPSPNLDQLKNAARDLLRAFRGDVPLARKRVAIHVPRLARSGTDLRLAEAQFVVAREHGFPSWPRLKQAVEAGALGNSGGPSGPSRSWRRQLLLDTARDVAAAGAGGDIAGLVRALSLLPRRDGDKVRGLLVESGAYPTVVGTLILGAQHPNSRLRFECAGLMDHFADERCVEPLLHLLHDPVPRVRRAALHALGCDGCKLTPLNCAVDIVELAVHQSRNDPSVQVRRHAVSELGARTRDPRATAALRRVLAEESDRDMVRIAKRSLRAQK